MPTLNPEVMILRIPALLIAITVHEYAHARVAYLFGDPTAKMHGRMTLNPISHLDPLGTLMLLLAGIGWAKPVPVNPFNFRDRRAGLLWVSFAGPLSNFIAAFIFLFLFYGLALHLNFNFFSTAMRLLEQVILINLVLGVFNLIPVPPLDGSKILTALAPRSVQGFLYRIEPYAPLILLVLIFTGALGAILIPIRNALLGTMEFIVRLFFGLT